MAMTLEQLHEYDSYISEGNGFAKEAKICAEQMRYEDSKECFFKAMEQYKYALILARSCNDDRQNKAYHLFNSARICFGDMGYKVDIENGKKNNDDQVEK